MFTLHANKQKDTMVHSQARRGEISADISKVVMGIMSPSHLETLSGTESIILVSGSQMRRLSVGS